ncbi:endothelin receptor type B-like [Pollicipes pollicipes]|uniref:endothelin receptor type B-like n=2 Tax=Pollicipes pollicipes TaxID=41117 RepID=UPI00188594C8|nr:endothelin receptor type B-like [Pollicipes pollicipes]
MVACFANCAVVLPLTLTVLLLENWVLGSTMCFMLPIMQDTPLNLVTLTLLLITATQYHRLRQREVWPSSSLISLLAVWLTSICTALPYLIYTDYLDMEVYFGPAMQGVGLCVVNIAHDVGPFTKVLFVCMYLLPMLLIGIFHFLISHHLNKFGSSRFHSDEDLEMESLDLQRQVVAHKYLLCVTLLYAVCLFPLMVLRVAKQAIYETYSNTHYFDIIYVVFVWSCFLPSFTTPALYLIWNRQRVSILQDHNGVLQQEATDAPGADRSQSGLLKSADQCPDAKQY